MSMPVYFKQEKRSTCSLAVLRMVLHHFRIKVNEEELENKVKENYGNKFSNIWNPTIAKLACGYGINTTLYALWPLLKKDTLPKALNAFQRNPHTFDVNRYENKKDKDRFSEPLPLAYKEMFLAVQKGCKAAYGSLTTQRVKKLLSEGYLIQTSIKLHLMLMYPDKKRAFHSILIYRISGNKIFFHDPFNGEGLTCTLEHLLKATSDVGAFMAYKI